MNDEYGGSNNNNDAGSPAWVMTFADLMSLLLAFFVLLFSFSELDKNVYKQMAGSLKQAFGVQREIKAKEPPKGINIIAQEFSPGRPTPTPYNEVRQVTTDDYKMHPVFTDPAEQGQENQDKKADEAEDKAFNSMNEQSLSSEPGAQADTEETDTEETDTEETDTEETDTEALETDSQLKAENESIRKALQKEIDEGLIELKVVKAGIILRIREKGSFPSGSAQLIEPFKFVTDKISELFSDFEGMIIVSGHTDNVPISTQRFRSNWELSASRAVSVVHELSRNKLLEKKRFQIAAYADTRPVASNKTAAGKAENRRVEIMLNYQPNPYDDIFESDLLMDTEQINAQADKYSFNPIALED